MLRSRGRHGIGIRIGGRRPVIIRRSCERSPCRGFSLRFFLKPDHLGGFGLELEASGIGAIAVVDMGLEERALGCGIIGAPGAFTFVKTGGRKVLCHTLEKLLCLGDVELGRKDGFESLVLLVLRHRGEQFGMADLDPAFIQRGFDRFG